LHTQPARTRPPAPRSSPSLRQSPPDATRDAPAIQGSTSHRRYP
jgi:hypothetical protein